MHQQVSRPARCNEHARLKSCTCGYRHGDKEGTDHVDHPAHRSSRAAADGRRLGLQPPALSATPNPRSPTPASRTHPPMAVVPGSPRRRSLPHNDHRTSDDGWQSPMTVSDKIDDAADSDAAEGAGRLGLATRGVMYLISASLTARIALLGTSAEGPGKTGALNEVADQPFGRVGLVLLAAGLAGYAVWRFLAAATYTGNRGESAAKVRLKRLGYLARGLIYVLAFLTAGSLILGDDGGSEGGEIARVFDLPAGRLIVLGTGAGFLAAAAYNAFRAIGGSYKKQWSDDISDRQHLATVAAIPPRLSNGQC